jgi:hypothetical protein
LIIFVSSAPETRQRPNSVALFPSETRHDGGLERAGDALALVLGLALRLAAPETRIVITRPMLLVAAGAVLLAVGLARDLDLARIALEGRPVATVPDRYPGELRLCLESALGLGAVAVGLAWRLAGASAALPVSVGGPVLALAVVATLGHLTRNLVVVVRREPAHRNVVFWS